MTAKQIKNLALTSYKGEKLDSTKVTRIAKLLTRSELKTYIKFLKSLEKAKRVTVLVSRQGMQGALSKDLKKMFPDKQIEFAEDKSLIGGIRIIDNDDIYDFNLKNTFENLVSYINK